MGYSWHAFLIFLLQYIAMPLKRIAQKDRKPAAKLLVKYWNSRGMTRYNVRWAEDYLEAGHRKEIAKDEFFLFRKGGKIVGVISLMTWPSKDLVEVRDEVAPNKGVLKKMIAELLELARKRKIRKVYSLSLEQNARTYASLGFRKEGVLKSHFEKGEDIFVMSRFL